ncbi:galactoside alpha-(1,2)-fucosyltransferase 2-like [Cloeon dipterum]|uniref:galactoside alpha-(1,2)-fucosyltransferase 2-like n=1 Tax=Cloeon dipterum TaxID=197152 RepID=UPI00321FD405
MSKKSSVLFLAAFSLFLILYLAAQQPQIPALVRPPPGFNLTDPESMHWLSCPEPGQGRKSTFVTADIYGRLGNVVWSYLSVVAAARRYNLRPVIDQQSLDTLEKEAFDANFLRVPSVDWLERTCALGGLLENAIQFESKLLTSKERMIRYLEEWPDAGFAVLKYDFSATDSELTTAFWDELPNELVLKEKYRKKAANQLRILQKRFQEQTGTDAADVEFVGIHVRRTDYTEHLPHILPGSTAAGPEFFHAAINWLKEKMRKKTLIFVAVSDDRQWTQENVIGNRTDVFMAGSSDVEEPGEDLAILAACNHSIFAYGTFGLTAASLASRPGGHTVLFDPQNGGVTKEMEFGANLPGWHIMDQHGNLTYQNTPISFHLYLHPHKERKWGT